ncbi:endonuclease domain-containing protein [Agromyces bauzanensis]
MSSITQHVRRQGGALSYAALERGGFSRSEVHAAVRGGAILRVRNGWFAVPDAHHDVVRAVRVGGTATAATVAHLRGLWVLDERLHVRVPHSTGRLAAPHDRRSRLDREHHGVCVHYSTRGGLDRGSDPLTLALAEMFACTSPTANVLATIDSALERQKLDLGHLDRIRAYLPRSRRRLLDGVDPLSQSGLETRIRLLLRSRRISHRAQADLDGVGRVDFVVGERLVIEADGRAFHTGEAFEEDRQRDFELVTRGYVVLRLSYRQIVDDWSRTSAGILAMIARGEHRWAGRGPHAAIPASSPEPGDSEALADA